jgi:hypothetical protein
VKPVSNALAIATNNATPPADLAALDDDALEAELVRAMGLTVTSLVRTAWIIRLMEERGRDLSHLKIGMLDYLRRIAYGQVAPELVVHYSESPALLRILASLPLPDQQRLASGEPVKLVVRRPEGKFDVRMVEPLKMARDQLALVFGRGKIRDEAEQILMLEDRQPRPTGSKGARRRGTIEPDPVRGGLVVGRKFFPTGDVIEALATLMGEPDYSVPEIAVPVKLTEAEHIALKNAATRTGTSMNVLIRRALMISGLFSGE